MKGYVLIQTSLGEHVRGGGGGRPSVCFRLWLGSSSARDSVRMEPPRSGAACLSLPYPGKRWESLAATARQPKAGPPHPPPRVPWPAVGVSAARAPCQGNLPAAGGGQRGHPGLALTPLASWELLGRDFFWTGGLVSPSAPRFLRVPRSDWELQQLLWGQTDPGRRVCAAGVPGHTSRLARAALVPTSSLALAGQRRLARVPVALA